MFLYFLGRFCQYIELFQEQPSISISQVLFPVLLLAFVFVQLKRSPVCSSELLVLLGRRNDRLLSCRFYCAWVCLERSLRTFSLKPLRIQSLGLSCNLSVALEHLLVAPSTSLWVTSCNRTLTELQKNFCLQTASRTVITIEMQQFGVDTMESPWSFTVWRSGGCLYDIPISYSLLASYYYWQPVNSLNSPNRDL